MPVATQTEIHSAEGVGSSSGTLKLRGAHTASPQTEVYADLDKNGVSIGPGHFSVQEPSATPTHCSLSSSPVYFPEVGPTNTCKELMPGWRALARGSKRTTGPPGSRRTSRPSPSMCIIPLPRSFRFARRTLTFRGGLFNRYGCGHEQFAWDIRSEPALIDVFAQIWGTDELLVSFGTSCPVPSLK
jgi:hypothetical protein